MMSSRIQLPQKGFVTPKTLGRKKYVDAIASHVTLAWPGQLKSISHGHGRGVRRKRFRDHPDASRV